MNVYRVLSTAVAGTALIAAIAPSAQAVDLEGTLDKATHTLPVTDGQDNPTSEGLLRDGLHKGTNLVGDTLSKGTGGLTPGLTPNGAGLVK